LSSRKAPWVNARCLACRQGSGQARPCCRIHGGRSAAQEHSAAFTPKPGTLRSMGRTRCSDPSQQTSNMTLFRTSRAAFVVAALMATGTFAGTSLMLAEPAAAQAAGAGPGGAASGADGDQARFTPSWCHQGPPTRTASPQTAAVRHRSASSSGLRAPAVAAAWSGSHGHRPNGCPVRVQSLPDLNSRGVKPDAGCQMPPFTPEGGIISSGTKKSGASGFDGSTR